MKRIKLTSTEQDKLYDALVPIWNRWIKDIAHLTYNENVAEKDFEDYIVSVLKAAEKVV